MFMFLILILFPQAPSPSPATAASTTRASRSTATSHWGHQELWYSKMRNIYFAGNFVHFFFFLRATATAQVTSWWLRSRRCTSADPATTSASTSGGVREPERPLQLKKCHNSGGRTGNANMAFSKKEKAKIIFFRFLNYSERLLVT